jgi:hypothetical protein
LLGEFAYCPKRGEWWARGLSAATWWKGFWLSSAGGGGFFWRVFGCLLWLCVLVGVVVD